MSGEVRRPVEGSVFALFGILILCFGVGILIHIVMDQIGLSPRFVEDKTHPAKGSISINMDRFDPENISKVVSIIDTYNKEMHPKLKRDIAREIHRVTLKFPNLDIDLICSIITYASWKTWDPRITSSHGAFGLMGIRPAIGKFFARYEGIEWTTEGEILFNPIYNIRIGARYLSTLIGRYGLEDGLAVYLMDQRNRRWPDKVHNGVYERKLKIPSQGVRDGETA